MKWVWITLLLVSPAIAAPIETPRFFIERIDVRNLRFVRPAIIQAELRMPAGREYTEQELRKASDRINRLPFVLDSEFSLEKGSKRGSYVLVIAVTETKPVFYSAESDWTLSRYTHSLRVLEHPESEDATVGARMFFGGHSEFHVAYSGSTLLGRSLPQTIAAGVTQYGLFGSSAFAQLNLKYPASGPIRYVVPDFLLGIPFGSTQTLTVDYSTTRNVQGFSETISPPGDQLSVEQIDTTRELQANLAYNTTEDPFFPTRGVILSISPTITWYRNVQNEDVFGQRFTHTFDYRTKNLALQAVRYWKVSQRNSISTLAAFNRQEEGYSGAPNRPDVLDTSKGDIGFLHSFWIGRKRAQGEMGLEFHIVNLTIRNAIGGAGPPYTVHGSSTVATAAWFHRSAWGTLRLGAIYTKGGIAPFQLLPVAPYSVPPLQAGNGTGSFSQ